MPTATINGREMHYLDEGQGFPLIFGHSFLCDAQMWQPQIDQFKKNFRCIVPELFSHGKSQSLDDSTPYSIEQMTADHLALLDILNIDKCIVIGLSVGGIWGTQLAVKHSKRIAGLVLCDTYVGDEPSETRHSYEQLTDTIEVAKGFTDPILDAIVPIFFAPETFDVAPEIPKALREQLSAVAPNKIPGLCGISRGIFSRQSQLGDLPGIKQPTLVIVGESDIPRPVSESQEMADLLPNSELCTIPHGGHICNLENPNDFNKVLGDFLQAVEVTLSQRSDTIFA